MKKLFQTALLILIPGAMVMAQTNENSASSATPSSKVMGEVQKETQSMTKDLHLENDQVGKVLQINLAHQNQLESYNTLTSTLSEEERKETLKKINDKFRADLDAVLTIAQSELYTKLHTDSK